MAALVQATDEAFRQVEELGPISAERSVSDSLRASEQTVSSAYSIERMYRHRLPVRISH
ncbi:MAG: hypothetical protein LV473_22060 [Nitrospira sp.]|nr:hypothetical protein [Nitrospira sp.]